jgi:hypothetical protein
MSSNNCIVPEVRPNVWIIVSTVTGKSIGYEVAAMSETEARIKASQHLSIPFTLTKE